MSAFCLLWYPHNSLSRSHCANWALEKKWSVVMLRLVFLNLVHNCWTISLHFFPCLSPCGNHSKYRGCMHHKPRRALIHTWWACLASTAEIWTYIYSEWVCRCCVFLRCDALKWNVNNFSKLDIAIKQPHLVIFDPLMHLKGKMVLGVSAISCYRFTDMITFFGLCLIHMENYF